MTKDGIRKFICSFAEKKMRTMTIIDYGNVEKWKISLGWKVDIRKLGQLSKSFSGSAFLRRFYYGGDYGCDESSENLSEWSRSVLERAKMNNFEVISKRVKYIHDPRNGSGFEKKCDLDVEMAVDMIREANAYDSILLFSGDGDLMHAVRHIHDGFGKKCYVFGARNHIGREVIDALEDKALEGILFAEDFEYRLRGNGFFPKQK